MCSERTLSAARAELNASVSTRAPCVNRVQPGPASSRFSKHSLLITFALSAACGGVRRPAGGGMRSYMGNTKSADTIVPMALNTTPACQRSSCADASGRHPACFALFREKKSKSEPVTILFVRHVTLLRSCRRSVAVGAAGALRHSGVGGEYMTHSDADIPSCTRD